MVKRSKWLAALLLLALTLACLAACGGPEEPADIDDPAADGGEAPVFKHGLLTFNNISAEDHVAKANKQAVQEGVIEETSNHKTVYFDTLSSMLLALEAGQINSMIVLNKVANYIVAGNDKLTIEYEMPSQETLSFAVLADKTELLSKLNDAIAALKADGTIDALSETHIKGASPEAEPPTVDIPAIAGADTIKVAITGDLPPIDYTTADGKPAGFNVALLAAISEKAGVNIELVSIDSGARVIALTSGKADAVFWMRSVILPDGTVDATADTPPEVALTDYYYTDTLSSVEMK